MADIIEALTKLDLVLDKDDEIPVFVARNIERLPDRQPEELNLLSIVNRLSSIEKNLKTQENILTEHSMELSNIKENNTIKNAMNDKEIQTEVDHEKAVCKRQETYDK